MFSMASDPAARFLFSSANEITNDCFGAAIRLPMAALAAFKKSGW
jgi:hypothetical protein